jgi:tetratricopeptide (TPR) repeat protein
MGRSLAPIADEMGKSTTSSVEGEFKAFGSSFQVVRQGKRMIHRQTRLDETGRPIWSLDLPVDFVIGSGTRGSSYLFQRDGFLFQTPISWFSQKRVWDRSPGFSAEVPAGRPVVPECLFCHANRALPREDSRNAYDQPIFEGFTIGCERCHGPGERHVRERKEGVSLADRIDHTIVNPVHLEPEIRDAVCAQCHLAGEPRLLRRGRGLYDFRPGMPLDLFWSVFVQERPPGTEDKAVNHFEQMHFSRCYQRSSGAKKLGCVSCHDAHELPAQASRVEFYRGRCLECHRERGCTVPRQERLRTSKEDSCIVCHMPPYSASDIPHTAGTNHRIVRRATRPADSGERKDSATLEPVPFYRANKAVDETEQVRDLGIALAHLASRAQRDAPDFARRALALLEKSLAAFPDDVPAWEAKGVSLAILGRVSEALAAYEAALARAPGRESSLQGAAMLAQNSGDGDKALTYWRRVLEFDPWAVDYRINLSRVLVHLRAWDEARPHVQAWLRLDPGSVEARKLHWSFLRRDGDREGAATEMDTIRRLEGRGAAAVPGRKE